MVLVLAALGPLPAAASAMGTHVDVLWTTNVGKQVTGYAALAFAFVSLLLSLRKRWARFTFSDVPLFRAFHASLGVLAMVALVLHTGLHLGKNLNRTLMIAMLALALLGSAAGVVTALSHWFSPVRARDHRLVWSRAHLIAFWPLPVLLVLHIVAVYYY
jgi:nitrite reductase (NADH) large subunit